MSSLVTATPRIVGRLRTDPRFVRLPASVAVEGDDARARQLLLDLLDAVGQIGADEQDRRRGIGHHVGDLPRRESPVHTDADGVQLGGAEEQLEVLRAVLVEERHPPAGSHSDGTHRLGRPDSSGRRNSR